MNSQFIINGNNDNRYKYLRSYLKDIELMSKDTKVYIMAPSIVISKELISNIEGNSYFFAFVKEDKIKDVLYKKNIKLFDLSTCESYAYKNALITAEGTIPIVKENIDIALFDINFLIIGFGRLAKSLCKVFKPLSKGIDILTFDVREYACASLYSDCQLQSFDSIKKEKYDVVINTIPVQIINENILEKFKKETFFLELASSPGGFNIDILKRADFNYLKVGNIPSIFGAKSAAKIILTEILYQLNLKNELKVRS